ncbi:MAG: CYTH domain-containing protein [Burkholderiales bacterium]|nr:CYTH domain-containing protein [Burkholderiales bacterium]
MDEKDDAKKEKKRDIEVELKFQPTEEQLNKMIEGLEVVSNVNIRDIYYDFDDFRLLKDEVRLRYRLSKKEGYEATGVLELKIKIDSKADIEINDKNEIKDYLSDVSDDIKNYFNTGKSIEELMKDKKLVSYIDFKTERKEYIKEGFKIDVDKLSFGYDLCEIEVMVEDENQIKQMKDNIKEFAKKYDFDTETKIIPKGWEYLRRFNPKLYEEIYLRRKENKEIKKDLNNEIKIK